MTVLTLLFAAFVIAGLLGIWAMTATEEAEVEPEPPRSYWLDVAYVGMKEMLGREPTVSEVWEATPPDWSQREEDL